LPRCAHACVRACVRAWISGWATDYLCARRLASIAFFSLPRCPHADCAKPPRPYALCVVCVVCVLCVMCVVVKGARGGAQVRAAAIGRGCGHGQGRGPVLGLQPRHRYVSTLPPPFLFPPLRCIRPVPLTHRTPSRLCLGPPYGWHMAWHGMAWQVWATASWTWSTR
jgi:hypothetical protein